MLVNEESLKHLKTVKDNTFDSCVTDPPYHLASILKRFGPGQKGINNNIKQNFQNDILVIANISPILTANTIIARNNNWSIIQRTPPDLLSFRVPNLLSSI